MNFVELLLGAAGGSLGGWYFSLKYLRPKWEKQAIHLWYPPAELGERLFEESQYNTGELATLRSLHDSRRLHPPRNDAGQPARMHKARVRPRRQTW